MYKEAMRALCSDDLYCETDATEETVWARKHSVLRTLTGPTYVLRYFQGCVAVWSVADPPYLH